VRQTLKASIESQGWSNSSIPEHQDAGGFSSAELQLLANLSQLSDMVHNSLDEMQECVTSERDGIPASADPLRQPGLQQEVANLQLAMSANLAQQSRFIAQMHVLSRLVFNTVMAVSNFCVERAMELTTKSTSANGSCTSQQMEKARRAVEAAEEEAEQRGEEVEKPREEIAGVYPASPSRLSRAGSSASRQITIARPITIARRDSLTGGTDVVSIESEFVISPAPSPAAVLCSKNLPQPPLMWGSGVAIEASENTAVHAAGGHKTSDEPPRAPRRNSLWAAQQDPPMVEPICSSPRNFESRQSTEVDASTREGSVLAQQKVTLRLEEHSEPKYRQGGDAGDEVYVGKDTLLHTEVGHLLGLSKIQQHGNGAASIQEDEETKRYAWGTRERVRKSEKE
jgi:hypothetical protein